MNVERIQAYLTNNRAPVYGLLHRYFSLDRSLLLNSDLADGCAAVCAEPGNEVLIGSALADMIHLTQEATVQAPWMWFAVRPDVGRWQYLRLHAEVLQIEQLPVERYLTFKESIALPPEHETWPLEIDLRPFGRSMPRLKEMRIYGFWKFMTNLERSETRRYLEMFHALQFRPRAQSIDPASI